MWEIIDEDGTIFSGSEEEMTSKFYDLTQNRDDDDISLSDEEVSWEGDLRLIQVHQIYR